MQTTQYRKNGQQWALVWVSIFLAIIAIVVTANLVFPPVGYYLWYPFGFGWIWVPFAFFLLFFAFRWFCWLRGWGYRRGYLTGDNAYYLLRKRFARGEITKEHFEQISRDFQDHERT